jgi:hypothetical protein
MVARPWIVALILAALSSLGAQYRTKNFVVEASTQPIAERVGQWAEHYRKEKAIQWLGKEMPPWGQPCPLRVKVSYNGSGGATSFVFDRGQILSMQMEIEGTLERLIASVLPHEVTHTVLAYHFRQPVPRWADEGGSVLSEDEVERQRHDQLVRQILNTPGRAIPLKRLFTLTQYPRDVMVLYAEGYSVTNFLVSKSSRGAFLNFLADGMRGGWDEALKTHYSYRNVEELEQAWVQHLRDNRRPNADTTLASASGRDKEKLSSPAGRVVVRQTLPPAMPTLGAPRPVARGVPSEDEDTSGPQKRDDSAAPTTAPPSPDAGPPAKLLAPRPFRPQEGGWDDRK